jgi:glucosamine 6-phosphate synthetase-like amidotransferase/phosphosugar isomerase protein
MYSAVPLPSLALPALVSVANSQVHRGHHAFGLAWMNEDRQIFSFKRPGSVVSHPEDVARGEGAIGLIGHTRWATHGDACRNDNNHPHPFRWQREACFLVHNGVIGNYESIAEERGLRLYTECDSEVLARHVEAGEGSILKRFADAVNDVDPYAPCAVAAIVPEGIVLARRGNPLFWSVTKSGTVWYASTRQALPGRVYQVPDDQVFLISVGAERGVRTMALRPREQSSRLFLGSDLFA